jgi:hypothetical protein
MRNFDPEKRYKMFAHFFDIFFKGLEARVVNTVLFLYLRRVQFIRNKIGDSVKKIIL